MTVRVKPCAENLAPLEALERGQFVKVVESDQRLGCFLCLRTKCEAESQGEGKLLGRPGGRQSSTLQRGLWERERLQVCRPQVRSE